MITVIRLNEAIDGILGAVQAALKAATADGELLADVETVMLGDHARTHPDLPAVWVFGDNATNDHNTAALRETWLMPVVMVAMVQGDDPEAAYKQAGSVAARSRSSILAQRDLGLAYVSDVTSTGYEPTRRGEVDNRTIYSAAAIVTVRFQVFE